ncbi:MAG: tetratricopeptide repeat protein [Bacteroidales bacterium]|nr:tetratricopeptide repeat protein [Bacteroidales bacterium]
MDGKSINRRKKTNNYSENTKTIVENEEIIKNPSNIDDKKTETNINFDVKKNVIYLFLLVVVTFGVFSPTFKNTFTNWDDGKYVAENPLIQPLNFETVKEIFFSKDLGKRYWMGNYHPLTMLSLSINYAFSEVDDDGNANAFGFQLVNIILHVLNTLLVFFVIKLLLKNLNIAFFAAILFGIHTLHVESVSWIAERKDVLYTFFFLLGLLSYIKYSYDFKIRNYLFAFLFFFLSLLSKGQAVTLAVTIILIDYFKDRKLLSTRVIVEKLLFLILAFVFGLIAVTAQKEGNALQVINSTPFLNRIGIASYGFTVYILKLFVPINLSAVYPYPDIVHQTIPAYFWLGLITVALTAFAAFKTMKSNKIIFLGIGFFVVNIVLLLQLLPVGSAIYADRYVYIPSIGFYLIFAYFLNKVKDKNMQFVILSVYVVTLSFFTINRIDDWKDSTTLWEDVVVKQPNSVVAWNNLGSEYNRTATYYLDSGNVQKFEEYSNKAIDCFNTAIIQKPDYTSAFYNRGFSKFNIADFSGDTTIMLSALEDFNSSISTDIEFFEGYLQRGIIYDWLGNYQKAIIDFNYALKFRPKNTRLIVNRGTTKGKTGDYDGAIDDFNLAISINPDQPQAYSNRGLAYAFKKEYELAIADYTTSLNFENDGKTFFNRGIAYFRIEDYSNAIIDFEKAIMLNFAIGELYFYKALSEQNLSQKEKACEDMQNAVNKGFKPALNYLQIFCG